MTLFCFACVHGRCFALYYVIFTVEECTYFAACSGLLSYAESVVLAWGGIHASTSLHARCLANVLRLPIAFYDTTPTGRVINRLSKDVDTIDSVIPLNVRVWLFCSFQVLASALVLGYSTPWILVTAAPLAVIYTFAQVASPTRPRHSAHSPRNE